MTKVTDNYSNWLWKNNKTGTLYRVIGVVKSANSVSSRCDEEILYQPVDAEDSIAPYAFYRRRKDEFQKKFTRDTVDELVDYKNWALAMCSLLDAIEKAINKGDQQKAWDLVKRRFEMAEKHGFKVEFTGMPTSSSEH